MPKKALITGVSGQDGAYLAGFLLNKGYKVVGAERQNASGGLWRLRELKIEDQVEVIPFELLEDNNINSVVKNGKFDEIYNLAAQSFVANSYNSPIFTSDVNALGVTRILEAVRHFSPRTRFYQASTSEMYGNVKSKRQNEQTSFQPVSPYAISKLYAHWIVNMYRDAYNIYCCSGILFNHESPLRGKEFVTKKIISDLAKVKYRKLSKLKLGNIYSKRDWGFALDYVEAIWLMLQQKKPDDFVICTGKQYTIKQFINMVAAELRIKINWTGKGVAEKAYDKNNNCIIECSKKYFRPAEVDTLKGDYSKAKKILKWKPKHNIKSLIKDMINYELNILKNDK